MRRVYCVTMTMEFESLNGNGNNMAVRRYLGLEHYEGRDGVRLGEPVEGRHAAMQ